MLLDSDEDELDRDVDYPSTESESTSEDEVEAGDSDLDDPEVDNRPDPGGDRRRGTKKKSSIKCPECKVYLCFKTSTQSRNFGD